MKSECRIIKGLVSMVSWDLRIRLITSVFHFCFFWWTLIKTHLHAYFECLIMNTSKTISQITIQAKWEFEFFFFVYYFIGRNSWETIAQTSRRNLPKSTQEQQPKTHFERVVWNISTFFVFLINRNFFRKLKCLNWHRRTCFFFGIHTHFHCEMWNIETLKNFLVNFSRYFLTKWQLLLFANE